jgi:glycolate oxidase
VKLANAEGLPFVARGAGTGLAGGCLPAEGGLVIALTRMTRILEVDYDNQLAVVEPGLVNLHLSQALAPRGYYYAPDPSSQIACTIGGNVANNSGGPHTLKYGVTTNHVLGLEVVLPDGEVVWLGGKARDPQGYDLVGVFVGSEGTFGIVTKVVVRILRRPAAVKTLLAVFDELDQASRTVAAITACGLTPAALEMIDHITIQAVEDAYGAGYPRDAAAALLIELDGLAVGLDEEAERVIEACRENGAREVRVARDEAERLLLWKGRKAAFGAYGRVSPAYFVMDGVIPRTRLPEVLRRIDAIVGGYGLRVGNVFHAGDGNLHPNILYDPRHPGEVERVLAAGAEIMKVCVEVGGSISGEHGIGIEKQNFMPWIFSEKDLEAMAAVKAAFNPTGRCNPGKVFPTAKSCVPGELAYRPHPLEERGLAQRL